MSEEQNKCHNKNHWNYILLCFLIELTTFYWKFDKKKSWFSNSKNFSNSWWRFPLATRRVSSTKTFVISSGNTVTAVTFPFWLISILISITVFLAKASWNRLDTSRELRLRVQSICFCFLFCFLHSGLLHIGCMLTFPFRAEGKKKNTRFLSFCNNKWTTWINFSKSVSR